MYISEIKFPEAILTLIVCNAARYFPFYSISFFKNAGAIH